LARTPEEAINAMNRNIELRDLDTEDLALALQKFENHIVRVTDCGWGLWRLLVSRDLKPRHEYRAIPKPIRNPTL
jgi:hypothetical protein